MAEARAGGSCGSRRLRRGAGVVVCCLLLATGCGSSKTATTTTSVGPTTSAGPTTSVAAAPKKSILQLAKSEGSLTTLLRLLDTAGLTATLQGAGPFSLIGPDDAAFAKLDPGLLERITQQPTVLKAVLQYHLVFKRLSTTDVKSGSVSSVEGSALSLVATSKLPTVNGHPLTKGAKATNGTIFVIDTVLIPPDITLP